MLESLLLADLVSDLPPAVRLQRLVSSLRTHFGCGAVALLKLEEDSLRPLAVDGLVRETLGRRFVVGQHPRLATILSRRDITAFDHDSTLPDPYDGLLDTRVGEPLPVHDCMGTSLHVEGQTWGALTFDALQTGTFTEAARDDLRRFTLLVEAAVRVTRLEQDLHVRLFQLMTWAFTPVYQSDSDILPWLRDRLVAPISKLWPAPPILAALVSGALGSPLAKLGLEAES